MIRVSIVEDNSNYMESLKQVIEHAEGMTFDKGYQSAESFSEWQHDCLLTQ